MKNLIYVNGDSFTEGNELGDDLIPGNNFSNYSLSDIYDPVTYKIITNTKQKFLDWKYSKLLESETGLHKVVMDTEYDRRWSTILENIIQRPVVNISSQGGSSNYAIAYRTLVDITDLLKQGHAISHVIIQVSCPFRYSYFGKKKENEFEPGESHGNTKKYFIKSQNGGLGRLQSLAATLWELEGYENEFSILRSLHDLYSLKVAIKGLSPDTRIEFVDSIWANGKFGFSPMFELKELRNEASEHLVNFSDELCKIPSMVDLIAPDEKLITPHLHFSPEVHKRFSAKLAELYFN